jgi:type II pantothenate kinase
LSVCSTGTQIGGSLAKLVYFTRSPLPPNGLDKAQIALGGSVPSSSSPPKEDSPFIDPAETAAHDDPTPLRPNPNGALTPRVLATGELPSNPFEHAQWASFSSSSAAAAGPSGSGGSGSSPFARSSAYPSAGSSSSSSSKRRSTMPNLPGGLINFTRFETAQIHQCIDFINSLIKQSAAANRVSVDQMKRGVKIIATGGGAHKFYDRFVDELGVEVIQEEEMDCLITGLSFITSIPNEVFWYGDELVYEISHLSYPSPNPTPAPHLPSPPEASSSAASSATLAVNGHQSSMAEMSTPRPRPPPLTDLPRPSPDPPKFSVTFAPSPSAEPQFPCLLVNIGSGVSIVKVDRDGSFERVSGTSLGGGTLWGLLSLLTDAESFDGAHAAADHARFRHRRRD